MHDSPDSSSFTLVGTKVMDLCYGENPYLQPAALFAIEGDTNPLAIHRFTLLEGKAPSFVNVIDYYRLVYLMRSVATTFHVNRGSIPKIAIGAKHGEPCGGAVGDDPIVVIKKMIAGDPLAIHGGLIICNFSIGEAEAEALVRDDVTNSRRLLHCVLAPSFTDEAVSILSLKKTHRCRVMANPALTDSTLLHGGWYYRMLDGEVLRQPWDQMVLNLQSEHLTKSAQASFDTETDLLLGTGLCRATKSNTIIVTLDSMMIGKGAVQTDRVICVWLADFIIKRGRHSSKGCVVVSDSFYPKPDGPEKVVELDPALAFFTTGGKENDAIMAVFKSAGITTYTIPDELGRMFSCH